MKKSMFGTAVLAMALAVGGVDSVRAEWSWSPIGLGIAAPVQLPWKTSSVYGLRLTGLFGYNADVYGLSCGIANAASGTAGSLEVGLFNAVYEEAYGCEIGIVNYNNAFAGLQVAGLNWNNTESYGLSVGAVNANQSEFVGGQIGGIVNWSLRLAGGQIGFVNVADDVDGFQIGAFNACNRMNSGIQIGLVNLICEGPLPVMVVANGNF